MLSSIIHLFLKNSTMVMTFIQQRNLRQPVQFDIGLSIENVVIETIIRIVNMFDLYVVVVVEVMVLNNEVLITVQDRHKFDSVNQSFIDEVKR